MYEVYQSVSDHTIYMYIHVEVPRYLVQEVAHGATPPEQHDSWWFEVRLSKCLIYLRAYIE